MKKLKLFALGLLSTTMFLSSCQKDDDDPTAPDPIISVTELISGESDGNIQVEPNTQLRFQWDARKTGAGADLETFNITSQGVNAISPIPTSDKGHTFPYDIANADDEQYIDFIEVSSGGNEGKTTFTFTVTDKDGQSASAQFEVTVKSATPLSVERNGEFFYHIAGSREGAFNLVSNERVPQSGSDANKDMKNTDAAGNTFTGSWQAANATLYVKAENTLLDPFDYDNVTEEMAMEEYNGGTPTASVSNPASGDIYIAKLRGGDNYAVIRIDNVDPTNNECACANTGKITFDYKKKS